MLFDDIDTNIQEIITKGDFAKKQSNKKPKFKSLWHDEFAPKNHIGHTNYLLKKYDILHVDGDFNHKLCEFIKDYLDDIDSTFNDKKYIGSWKCGRGVKQIECIANHISRRCNEEKITFSDGMENDIEKLMCLIINHACTETLTGKYGEMIVEEYFESFGLKRRNKTDIDDAKWDSNGVDILLYKDNKKNNGEAVENITEEPKLFRFVQVKPKSFMIGNKPDLVTDRKKCIEQNQPFVDDYLQLHFLEAHNKIRPEIIYCFYDEKYRFINFNRNKNDDGVFVTYNDFANEDGNAKYTSSQIDGLPAIYLTNFKKKD
jgi:hypothetical protein